MYDYDISQYARSLESSLENADTTNAVWGALGAMAGIYLTLICVIALLQIIGMWRIFTKAGQKGWKSIIPIYNIVVLYKIIGLSPWLILLYLTLWIPFVGFIVSVVLTIYQANSLAKSFDKDIGYTIGLIFLPPIFYMILGLGNSQYVGPAAKATATSSVVETPITTQKEEKKDEE